MEHKRLTLFAGHYGSGKTNIAVNYAMLLADEGKKVCIADLDIVNPYFRTKDSEKLFADSGIELIALPFANTSVDLPAMPSQAYGLFDQKNKNVIIDLGGDDRGALALGRFVPRLVEENDCVVIGRCADYVLRNYDNRMSIFIYADMPCRIRRICLYT